MTPDTPHPSLLSNAHGSLRRVLLTVPWWILRYRHHVEFAGIAAAFEGLLTQLPQRTEWVVCTRRECESALHAWLASLGVSQRSTVVLVDDDLTLTAWAQDACLVTAGGLGAPELVAPTGFERQDDAKVLASVAAQLGVPHRIAPVAFQGGNVLVGDDFWLVGEDSVQETVDLGLASDRDAAVASFREWLAPDRTLHVIGSALGIPVQVSRELEAPTPSESDEWTEIVHRGSVEGTRQPVFDLDAFVSLAGRGEDGTYRILVGDPAMAAELTGTGLPDHVLHEVFDDIAEQFRTLGFRVIRNPLPMAYYDDGPSKTRLWYFASSNNVLTEIDGDTRNVWIPTYHTPAWPELAATDQANLEIWRRLGFTPHALPSFHDLARDLGAARCLCKSLSR